MKNEELCNQMINEIQNKFSDFSCNESGENKDKIRKIAENYFENVDIINFKLQDNIDKKYSDKNNFYIVLVNNKKIIKDRKRIYARIKEELKKLNYNYSYKGTRYLEECIYLIYTSNDEKDNLTKDIYPLIAEKYNTSIENVKCNIIQSSNISYYECPQDVMENYFGFSVVAKPKTKDIIYAIIRNLEE